MPSESHFSNSWNRSRDSGERTDVVFNNRIRRAHLSYTSYYRGKSGVFVAWVGFKLEKLENVRVPKQNL